MPFLLIFIIVPIVELAIFIKVGGYIGVLWTLALIILTAIVGVNLLRQQGLSVLMRAGQKMNEGSLPARELAEGFLLALAGALLLTPGFVTDGFGFSLLIPTVRGALVDSVIKMMAGKMQVHTHTSGPFGNGGSQSDEEVTVHPQRSPRPGRSESGSSRRPEVIDGEFRRED